MMEWVVVLKIFSARDFPMPDEQPVTLEGVNYVFDVIEERKKTY